MDRPARVTTVVGLVVFAAYFVGLHALIVHGRAPGLALVLVVAPWAIAAVAMGAKAVRGAEPPRRAAVAIAVLSAALVATWLAFRFGGALAESVEAILYAENVAFFAWLFALFAFSLVGGREPLVTQMARRVRRGDMPPSLVRYARGATIAWAAFFLVAIAVSTALFFTGSRAAWSLFVNLLIWPATAAMFAGEYAVRRAVLRDVRHDSLWAGIHAFRERGGDGR